MFYHGIRREEICGLRFRGTQSRQGDMHFLTANFSHLFSNSTNSARFLGGRCVLVLVRKCQSKHTVDRLIRSQRDFTT